MPVLEVLDCGRLMQKKMSKTQISERLSQKSLLLVRLEDWKYFSEASFGLFFAIPVLVDGLCKGKRRVVCAVG